AALERQARDHLEAQVADPTLRAKLTPDYPIGCKRVLFTDDYYPALQQPNVSLVIERIERIAETGVVTRDGAAHDVDVIIYATGFETTGWHWSLDVRGRGGAHLNELWKDGPEAYLGILTSGFPNMFMLYGPNTNLAHNSISFMIECQVGYMLKALGELKQRSARCVDVKA